MSDKSQSLSTRRQINKSGFGDLEGGIHDSMIAGRDIIVFPAMPTSRQVKHNHTAYQVLIVHAPGDAQLARQLREPIQDAGYPVAYCGSLIEGESVVAEATPALSAGGAVVFATTVTALGTGWAHRVAQEARRYPNVQLFLVQMDEQAYIPLLAPDKPVRAYWRDPLQAIQELMADLEKYCPLSIESESLGFHRDTEARYQKRVLQSCDIVDLANLPETDRHVATRRFELRRLYVALRVRLENTSTFHIAEKAFKMAEARARDPGLNWGGSCIQPQDGDKLSIGEVLSSRRQLVILGDPGSGKTTMIRWLATAYILRLTNDPDWRDLPDANTLPEEDWMPIVVRCRDQDPSRLDNLDDILRHILRQAQFSERETSCLEIVLRNKLAKGRALLLFDGLDEIADSTLRARFCHHIEQFHLAYPDAPIIVTSRTVGYRETGHRIGRGFEHVTIVDLSKEDKDTFAHRWCSVTELPEHSRVAAEELIHDIHSSDRVERLTGNPLLLTTMALVKRKIGKLPQRRADLYWEAVQVLLNWRSAVDEPIDYREAIPQLEFVAYAMCNQGVQQLREDEILDLLGQMREQYPQVYALNKHSPEDFLDLLERRTGILVESGRVRHFGYHVRVFEFRHLTFQEYLAGLALVDGKFPDRDPSLTLAENVALLAGRTSKVNQHPFVGQDVVAAENWCEALRICVASCRDDDVDGVLRAILAVSEGEDDQTTARPRAVLAALCLADEPNASDLIGEKILREFAKQITQSDGATFERTSADTAACELVVSRWRDLLSTALVEEYSQRDTVARVTNQANIGGLCALVAAASAPEDEDALSLWLMKQASVVSSDDDPRAITAALAVMELAFKKRAQPVAGIVEGLLSMLARSAPVAHAAAWALYWLNGGSSGADSKTWQPSTTEIERLLAIVGDFTFDAGVVSFLIPILGRECGPCAVDPLIARLEDEDWQVRRAAAEALGRIGDARAVEPLIARVDDIDRSVAKMSMQVLGWLGDPKAVRRLIAELQNQDPDTRTIAAEALVQIKDPRIVEFLVDELKCEGDYARQIVVEVLGRVGDAQAVGPLIAMLGDAGSNVRRAAVESLGHIGDARAVKPLIRMLGDKDNSVHKAVMEVLGKIGNVELVAVLSDQLDDEDGSVRQATAEAIKEI